MQGHRTRAGSAQEDYTAFERGYDAFGHALLTRTRAENPHRAGHLWAEWQAGYNQAEHEHRQRLAAYLKWCQTRRAKGFLPPLTPAPRPLPAEPRQRKRRRPA
jgi:hypothetical protein